MPEQILELKPRPGNRVTITLAGGRLLTIPDEQAQELMPGFALSDDDIVRLERMDQYYRGKEKALRLLALRARSKHEIITALAALDLQRDLRDGIVAELEEIGLIDDSRFAHDYVRVRADNRGVGPHRLRIELKKFGIARSLVDEVLVVEFEPAGQEARAWLLVNRKIAADHIDEKVVRRISGMLKRKGYDYAVVNRIAYELLRRTGVEDVVE